MKTVARVTAWEWWDPKEELWKHHHIEDGWSEKDMPTPLFKSQEKAWKNMEFRKEHMYLLSTHVVVTKEEYEKEKSKCPSIKSLTSWLKSTVLAKLARSLSTVVELK